MIEIERRALLSERDFLRIKSYLEKQGQYLGKRKFTSFLFRDPHYLRIRIEGTKVTVTEKEGDYEDIGREEKTTEIKHEELYNYILEIYSKGFKKCAVVKTERETFQFNGVTVELNRIDALGLIAEIEALTENSNERDKLDSKIKDTLNKLGLRELPPERYKEMMSRVYDKSIDVLRINL